MDEALFTFSRRGRLKLVQDGANQSVYTFYNRDGTTTDNNNTVFWRCDHFYMPKINCRATAYTERVDSKERVRFVGKHNHPPKEWWLLTKLFDSRNVNRIPTSFECLKEQKRNCLYFQRDRFSNFHSLFNCWKMHLFYARKPSFCVSLWCHSQAQTYKYILY